MFWRLVVAICIALPHPASGQKLAAPALTPAPTSVVVGIVGWDGILLPLGTSDGKIWTKGWPC
jgi:hypothetical protein